VSATAEPSPRFAETHEQRVFGQRLELTAMRADGSEFPELALGLVEGEPLLICGALRDLTEMKRAEDDLRKLADEQAALRRVATLIAEEAGPGNVFSAVAKEVAQTLDVPLTGLVRFESDGTATQVGVWGEENPFAVGTSWPLDERLSRTSKIARTTESTLRRLVRSIVGSSNGENGTTLLGGTSGRLTFRSANWTIHWLQSSGGSMKSFADGKIEVYLGPKELGGPDDLEQAVVDFIEGARSSLDIAAQEIDSLKIAEAIINARWRGVSTNVFVEQDYIRTKLKKKPEPPEPDVASGETPAEAVYRMQWRSDQETAEEDLQKKRESLAINRVILAAFLRNGIEVKGDFNPKIFHQKFIVRDYRRGAKPTSALLAGSANFTLHDTHDNLNNLFVFHDARVCREYAGEFRRLELGQFGRGLLGDVPTTFDLNGIPVKVAFAPDHSPELELMKQLLTVGAGGPHADIAGHEIWFAIFTFNGSSGIDDALLALARGGVRIRGVLDRGQARQRWGLPPWLKHENLEFRVPPSRGPAGFKVRKVHHKTAVIDGRTVVAGSFNYTRPANDYNDENIFVVGSTYDEIKEPGRRPIKVDAARCKELAKYVQGELERIFNLSTEFTPGT
jgi:phosphatidylserine/phosphatidylglycerophosphate/cardiolipin synthase-like enzyme